jgi:hypothetical protein
LVLQCLMSQGPQQTCLHDTVSTPLRITADRFGIDPGGHQVADRDFCQDLRSIGHTAALRRAYHGFSPDLYLNVLGKVACEWAVSSGFRHRYAVIAQVPGHSRDRRRDRKRRPCVHATVSSRLVLKQCAPALQPARPIHLRWLPTCLVVTTTAMA